jgi:hypothetical protein
MKFLSPVYSQVTGSIGGITYSHNRYGYYSRTRVVPVNPSSSRQQAVRGNFLALANDWLNALTAAQRAAWNLYASNVTVKDKMGQDINWTGYNHFLRTNLVAVPGNVSQVNDGPTIFSLAEGDVTFAATISEATQLISVTFDTNLDWVGEDDALMQVSMSKPVSPGRAFITPQMRVSDFILGDSGTPPTSPQTMTAPWYVTETQQVIVEGRILRADGRLSNGFRVTISIAA